MKGNTISLINKYIHKSDSERPKTMRWPNDNIFFFFLEFPKHK
ncbi:unnamed protein product, partial [Vitis vinifera]